MTENWVAQPFTAALENFLGIVILMKRKPSLLGERDEEPAFCESQRNF